VDLRQRPDVWDEKTLYADDLTPGDVFGLGPHHVTTEALTSFASAWDPQFFHVDEEAARRGLFGGLIASGIHTLAVFQRLSVAAFWGRSATIAAQGMREVRFLSPMRPGTTLVGRIVVDEVRPRSSERSLVTFTGRLEEDTGTVVLTLSLDAYLARRPGESPQRGVS
jgi:acyl dehydratase